MKHSVFSNPLVAFPNPWSIQKQSQRKTGPSISGGGIPFFLGKGPLLKWFLNTFNSLSPRPPSTTFDILTRALTREAEEASQYLSRYREDHPLHPDPAAGGAAAFACCCQKRCPLASWAAAQETMTAPISCSYRCASMQSNQ